MELEAIPVNKLRELARYLDEFPTPMPGNNSEEFWRLLIKKLPRQMYSKDQVEEFAEEVQSISGSPSLKLLYDLRGKKSVKFEQLLAHLTAIKCHKALNMFTPTKIPIFKEHPQSSVQVREGETVVLSCVVECVPSPPLYQWFHDRTPLAHENESHLKLKNIHQGHNGLYCCRATNPHINNESDKHMFSKFTKLSVSQFPVQETAVPQLGQSSPQLSTVAQTQAPAAKVPDGSLIVRDIIIRPATSDIVITKQPPSNLTSHYDESFELECYAMSKSGKKLTYQWIRTKPGQREVIGSSPKLESTWSRAGILQIQCEITNEEGEKVSSGQVEVKVITVWFTEQPQSIRASSKQKVILTCKAEGKTPVRYIWFNSSLRKSKKKIIHDSNNDALIIDAATVHDTGFYSCQAEVAGDIVTSETVQVQVGDQKDFSITRQPKSYVSIKRKPITLSCEATGDPSFMWYHNDEPMEGEERAMLHFPEVTDATFGTYKCRVTGNNGRQEFTKPVRVESGVSEDPQKFGQASIQLEQIQAESEFKTASGLYYAREKLALLLGNQEYESDGIASLTSPVNDITKLKETLEKLNFKVFAFVNLKLVETLDVLNRFCEILVDAGMYAVFYYAGHGFEHQNVDYIMPVDAQLPLKCDECYSVNFIASKLQERKSKVFMFLDSCRVSYDSKVEGPTNSRQQSRCAFSNLYKASSCVARQPAFEKASDECSVFNKALREGLLAEGNDLEEVILDTMKTHSQSKAGGVYQRPVFVNRLIPRKISLRDEIFWDDTMISEESEMAEVENSWEITHSIPKPIDLSSKPELSQWVRGSVKFQMALSNVMMVTAEFTAQTGYMQPSITLDTEKLRSQKVIVVQTCDEEGKASYRISDLQRHKDGKLELVIQVTVVTSQVTGEEKQSHVTVNHRINNFAVLK